MSCEKITDNINNPTSFGSGNAANVVHTDVANEISGIPEKILPIATDLIIIEDSEDGFSKKSAEIGSLPTGGGGTLNHAALSNLDYASAGHTGFETTGNLRTTFQVTPDDTHYPSEKLVKDSLDAKQDTLLFTPEDVANKVTAFQVTPDDTHYPSEKLVKDSLDAKQDTLLFTPENTANKENTTIDNSTTKYPTVNLLKTGLDAKADATATTNSLAGKKVFHGIQTAGTLAFDNTSHVLTINLSGGHVIYWYLGTKYDTTSAITCDLDSFVTLTANTTYRIYFDDATGTLKASASSFNLWTQVPVATVMWNGSAGAVISEKHNEERNISWHIWSHLTVGARYESGLSLTNPTTVNDALLQIESGNIWDEDQNISIGQQTTMRGVYQAASNVYTWANYSLPYLGTSGQPQYLDTDTYLLTNIGATNFGCFWVYATGDIDRPIYIIPTQAATDYNTLALARAENPPALTGLNLNADWKLIYRFIYKGDGNFQELTDYRSSSPLPGGGTLNITASSVSFVPSGGIAATNVQLAIEELDTEKGDMFLATAQAVTGLKTFDKDKIATKGTSTGKIIISNDNTGANDYTQTLQAVNDTIVSRTTTDTLTNKRITKRVQSVTDAATVTPNADADDCVDITAIAQAFTIANPSGTPTNFQQLLIRIKDNGTARAISFGTNYVAGGVALPTTTVLGKILTLGFQYNTANSLNKWQLVASAQEA